MMIMENDEFKIPEQYQKMSVAQLEQEAEKLFAQIKKEPRNIQCKKQAPQGQKEVIFFT